MRTRRRGLAVAGLAVLGLLATTVPAHAAASPADDPLDLANFELRPNKMGTELKDRVARLDEELPRAGVKKIFEDANRTGVVEGGVCNENADLDGTGEFVRRLSTSMCFNSGDNSTMLWYPQGVSTIADAQDDKHWGAENQPVLVSWYDSSKKDGVDDGEDELEKGVRVSFMDPHTGRYRHVLLVYPTINSYDNPSYMSVRYKQTGEGTSLHGGGIVWYGNHLYVADTGRGFRVFDMRHIYDLGAASNGSTQDRSRIGRRSGTYHGHGYRYVMPQVASWTVTAPKGEKCTSDDQAMSFSYAGLDRSGLDHMLAGEYCKKSEEVPGRVAAWPIAGATDEDGEQITDTGYRWQADAAHELPYSNIQGAVRFHERWYLSQSRGNDAAGLLYQTDRASASDEVLRPREVQPAAVGPEDLSHWEEGRGGTTLGNIWTVAEHPNRRMVYASVPKNP
ncbi:hypothetical protein FHR84_000852 [Actinopolyspora biskrensis]|uniref:Secreted protein n=1 Tax=Actinopolyspora biskrensis TaxID=1470178 RepID=A0A852YU96_9ACTN|nr:hypothetical protein [Actinopolyspora biskrensis]NYH77538.1 hypothetical protein [Actinopolyspora biskrensis]